MLYCYKLIAPEAIIQQFYSLEQVYKYIHIHTLFYCLTTEQFLRQMLSEVCTFFGF